MTENQMREIKIEKVTLNIGVGNDQAKLEKGLKLLKSVTGIDPVKTTTNKRIQEWGIRPGLPIGCKVTLRKDTAKKIIERLLEAKDNKLSKTQIDDSGNVSFGIHEYIDIPGVKYNPEIGIIGLEVCITLERPGYRIKKRKVMKRKVPLKHKVTKEDAIKFMEKNFKVKVE